MSKETKTDTPKNEASPAPLVKDDAYYNARIGATKEAIDAMPQTNKVEKRAHTQIMLAYEDVNDPAADDSDADRYKAYLYLKLLDSKNNLDSIKSVRSSDPHTQSYHTYALHQATQLLNSDANFSAFAPLRQSKDDPNRTLNLTDLTKYLAGKYEDSNPYNKATTYTLPTTDDANATPEVV